MSKHEMLKIIEQKRAELIDIVLKTGLSSSLSIKYSQDLDRLLNNYNDYEPTKKNANCL
ncbi:Spo0E family sporulation regulatory protein-aspartic acid phosphatase [Metabacillus herbersteinensis]|uniref:Spo0E family sporulation regulatory protein-aspartic acid phosphatase n=1 Tax=Metabacillus herbersteinensis TaxID=283816 RepID=A0ABV6GKN7_9BACI